MFSEATRATFIRKSPLHLEPEEWNDSSLFYDPVTVRDGAETSASFTSIHILDLLPTLAQYMIVTIGKLLLALLNTQGCGRISWGNPGAQRGTGT